MAIKEKDNIVIHEEKRNIKLRIQRDLSHDLIDVKSLPPSTAKKAKKILDKLDEGKQYWQLGGKLLTGQKSVATIPIGLGYRLMCRKEMDIFIPFAIISHEKYNGRVNKNKKFIGSG